jgi:hypothetical protein
MFIRRTIEAPSAKLSTPKRHPAKRGPRYPFAERPSRPNIDCFFIWAFSNSCELLEGSLSLSLKVVSGIFISELPSDCHRGCRVSLFVVRDKDGTGSNIAFDKATRIARFKWSERNSKKLAAPCERHLILMLLRHLGGHFLHTNLKYVMHESGCCNRRFGFVMFSSQAREICRSTVSTTSVKEGPDTSLISMRSLVFTGRHCVLARSCLSDSRRFS